MFNKFLIIPIVALLLFTSCDSTEPEFSPNKIFIEVENGTLDSDGEFEVFNYSSQPVFINYFKFPYCSFFTYSVEQLTDSGYVSLSFNESEGKWRNIIFDPDSIYVLCELYMSPVRVNRTESFKQKITGFDQTGVYRITINYYLKEENNSRIYSLVKEYKVTY